VELVDSNHANGPGWKRSRTTARSRGSSGKGKASGCRKRKRKTGRKKKVFVSKITTSDTGTNRPPRVGKKHFSG